LPNGFLNSSVKQFNSSREAFGFQNLHAAVNSCLQIREFSHYPAPTIQQESRTYTPSEGEIAR
jgi:hypothetical protein